MVEDEDVLRDSRRGAWNGLTGSDDDRAAEEAAEAVAIRLSRIKYPLLREDVPQKRRTRGV